LRRRSKSFDVTLFHPKNGDGVTLVTAKNGLVALHRRVCFRAKNAVLFATRLDPQNGVTSVIHHRRATQLAAVLRVAAWVEFICGHVCFAPEIGDG